MTAAATAATASPPGPSSAASLQLYRWMSDPIGLMDDCRRRYGDTFALRLTGAGELVFISDPASIKQLFGGDRRNRLAPGRGLVLGPVLGPRSLLLVEGEQHLRRRRLMLPPFHGERMRAYEQVMVEAAERDIARWPLGTPFALQPRMQSITLDVILRAVFGVDEARGAALRDALRRLLAAIAAPSLQAVGLATRRLGRYGPYRRFLRMQASVDELLMAEIARRRADPEVDSGEDILALLIAARFDDGEAMSDAEIRDQLMTLLLAGHETTATSLAWALDLLFRSPDAFARLRDEAERPEHQWADAVATETLRVRPVILAVGRELTAPTELAGYELDAGTSVFACIYLVHTREDLYPDPYAFRPERFLDDAPETYAWLPFGGGTRRCIGAAFAQLELRVVLETVMRHTVLEPARAEPEQMVRRNVTLAPKHGTPAVLRERR
jgi:cytochrome P450